MKSILLTSSKSPSNNHLLSTSVGSHNHRKNDSNRNETEDVIDNVNSSVIENIEKEQYNKLINHSNNIKKQVIRSKIIAKNDDKLKRVSSDNNNILSGGNNVNNFNEFLLTSTESHPLIDTNNIAKLNDNDNIQKTATKFLNLHSKNGTTLIFQRKNCLQSRQQQTQQHQQQQNSSGVNVNEDLKKESFKKRQSLQWPVSSAVSSNKFDNRSRHHSWYDDTRYPNAIEEEFQENSPLTQLTRNDENNLAEIKTIVASSILNIPNNEYVPDNTTSNNVIMKTSSIENSTSTTTTTGSTNTSSKRWRIEQFLKSLVGKRSSSAAPTSTTTTTTTTNSIQKVSKSPSAYDLLPQKSSRCGSITSLNKDRLINKSTASLNSTSLAMVHQKLWSVVPLLNHRKDGSSGIAGASCNNLLANLNGNVSMSHSHHSHRMRKCETVLALSSDEPLISTSSRRNHSKSINSLLEPIRPLNRLRNSQSCYVNCDLNQSFTTNVRQIQECSHCSSLLSLAAVGDSNYSLTNGAFVLKNTCNNSNHNHNNIKNNNGNRTKRNSATVQEDLLMTTSNIVVVDDDDDCGSNHNLIENDFNSIEPYDTSSVKLSLVKGHHSSSITANSSILATKFTCKLCLGEFFNEDKLTTIASCNCTFCTECMRAYVEFEISEGAYELSCPDALCNSQGIVSLNEISQLATASLVAKHHRYRLNREVELDKYRLWCPNRNCETICSVIPANEKPSTSSQSAIQQQPSSSTATLLLPRSVLCPTCNLEFCSSCKKAWHPSITCEENSKRLGSRNDSMMLFDNDLIKNCPMCAVPIEKDEGCAQMMCKRCKHVFCWYCLASLDDDFLLRHYDKGPCKNKLGHSRASVVWHRAQVIGIFAGFGILLLVASPLLLLAAPCIVCCKCKIEESTTVGKLDEPEHHSDHQV
ncbi:E3 ubiquitin-protein ligase DDB_G0292642 [Chironomus tepperi]|uniref:E3 ubiquitin-protein ligase DDB_G0292642 n=1 Tax=Chironomus tepperi TaxID=113505 RepID=UPI00391F4BEE